MFAVFLLLSSASVSEAPAQPPALTKTEPAAPKTRRVCQTIEVPMSRMPKRVCTTVPLRKDNSNETPRSQTTSAE